MDWAGQTACCIASGPSLTAEDVALVQAAGLKTIAVNNAWELARFCDVLYAGDLKWWAKYGEKVDVPAQRWTSASKAAEVFGLKLYRRSGGFNSGQRAVDLAASFGAKRILMLGYDCSVAQGTHFHGDHAGLRNPDAKRCRVWAIQFIRMAMRLKKIEVINCSRRTSMTCFKRMPLEDALCRTSSSN